LYIHCLSGRGRTGTIAIPLLMALYPPVTNLPPVVEAKFEQMRGATPESNWMVQGRVMLGEVPGGWNGNQAEDLTHILHCNVNVIC